MKATVDLVEALTFILNRLENERLESDPDDFSNGWSCGVEHATNAIREFLALPSIKVEPEP